MSVSLAYNVLRLAECENLGFLFPSVFFIIHPWQSYIVHVKNSALTATRELTSFQKFYEYEFTAINTFPYAFDIIVL